MLLSLSLLYYCIPLNPRGGYITITLLHYYTITLLHYYTIITYSIKTRQKTKVFASALETRNFIINEKTVVLSAEVLTHLPDQYVTSINYKTQWGAQFQRKKKKSLIQGFEPCELPI